MYAQITANKRKTALLMIIFSLFAVFLIAAIGVAIGLEPDAAIILGIIFSVIYSLISYYAADSATLATAGAKAIDKRDHFDLYTSVENLAITSGLPTPKIYIIDDPSPNAFATGRDPNTASIAVTTGLLRLMNKQELQGVLAHEMSHIKNYDIRVMTVVVVLVGLIILASDILFRVSFVRGNSRSKSNGQAAIFFLLIGILGAILAPIVAQIIKLAVSRSREYLADASGTLLTRHPEGLASALEKIKNHSTKLKRASHATAHLYISNPFGSKKTKKISFLDRLFMTHPPLEERISKLRNIT